MLTNSNIQTTHSSLECRRLLKDLKPTKEKRKGRQLYMLAIPFLIFPAILFFLVFIYVKFFMDEIDSEAINIAIFLSVIFFCVFILFFLGSKDLALYIYNCYDELISAVTDLLVEGEEIITYTIVSPKLQPFTPSWIRSPGYLSCVVFTTDRSIIINFKRKDVGGLVKELNDGLIDHVSYSAYSVDMLKPDSFKIYGFVSIFLIFGFRNMLIKPEGKDESVTFMLHDRFSRNGGLIREINRRIKDYHQQKFSL